MASILICEDEYTIREPMAQLLGETHKVILACNGTEALQNYFDNKIDLIITDLLMPGLTGIELINKVKEIDNRVKIIALSALLGQQDINEMVLEAGADLCLAKPVSLSKLIESINNLLG